MDLADLKWSKYGRTDVFMKRKTRPRITEWFCWGNTGGEEVLLEVGAEARIGNQDTWGTHA